MSALEPPRFEDAPPMLLAGLRRVHGFAEAPREIPQQWVEFNAMAPIPGRKGHVAYGAMCGTDHERRTMEYMCAVEVESFDALPQGMGRMRVPAARYAVFTHRGHVSGLRQTWAAIWQEWLPASGIVPGQTPDFEKYDERFDPATGNGVVEIWFPVENSGSAPT